MAASTQLRVGNRGQEQVGQSLDVPILGDDALWDDDSLGHLAARLEIGHLHRNTWYTNLNTAPATRGSTGFSVLDRLVVMPRVLWELPSGITFDYALERHRIR